MDGGRWMTVRIRSALRGPTVFNFHARTTSNEQSVHRTSYAQKARRSFVVPNMKPARFFSLLGGLRSFPPRTYTPLRRNIGAVVPNLQKSPFHRLLARNIDRRSVRHLLTNKRFYSTKPPFNPTPHLGSPPSLSLSQRLRKLSREYGWSALGVYLALSALDFPFCFLAVRLVGTERIGYWESVIVEGFWKIIGFIYPFDSGPEPQSLGPKVERYGNVVANKDEVGVPGYDHGVNEAEERNKSEDASTFSATRSRSCTEQG